MTGVENFLKHEQLKTYFSYQKKEVESILSLTLHTVDVTAGVNRVLSDIVEVFFKNGGRYMKSVTNASGNLSSYIKILLYDERIIETGSFYVLSSKGVEFYLKNKYDETAGYYYANIINKLRDAKEITGAEFRRSVPDIFANDVYANLLELQKLGLIKIHVDYRKDYLISV